jgi:Zn-dependent metalloprotease
MKTTQLFSITSALGLVFSLNSATVSAAENPASPFAMPFSPSSPASLGRLFKAYEGIRKNVRLSRLLKKRKNLQLSLAQRLNDERTETTKFQAYFNGLEVIGDMALHHESAQGVEIANYISEFDLDTTPALTAEQAIAIAVNLDQNRDLTVNEAPALKILPSETRDSATLLYAIHLQGGELDQGSQVLINAHTGAVIAHLAHHMPLAPVDVLSATERCQKFDERGKFASLEPSLCDSIIRANRLVGGRTADPSAVRALRNSVSVLNYFSSVHRRNSYDGAGATITNVVHVGNQFANAFWHPHLKIMAYGDGDDEMKDMTLALDVAGHEITHAITTTTANLMGMRESGALNEAYSDFFGKMIENRGSWAIGKDLYADPASLGLRNLKNPTAVSARYLDSDGNRAERPYPATYSTRFIEPDRCNRSNDYCWVHLNATIPGHASYLVYRALGKTKAEKLYYNVLTQRLTATARFADARNETLKACVVMFTQPDCAKVAEAFRQVGL